MPRPRLFTALLAVALLAAGALAFRALSSGGAGEAAQGPAPGPRPPLVETVRARPPESPPTIRQTGFVEAYREVEVAFEVQGRIAELAPAFEIGRKVARGAMLARIDTERLEAARRRAEADLAAARARAAEARQRFRRVQELAERDVSAESRLEDARAARDSATAQVQVAEAALDQAAIDLRDAEATAPFDAYVTARTASAGQIVAPGQPVGSLVRADRARIVVGLADRQLRAVGAPRALTGAEVAVRRAFGPGGRLGTGTVTDVELRIDPAARTTNLVVELPDPFAAPAVRLGELVAVDVPLATEAALVAVPAAAVKDGDTVWLVGAGGTLARRSVEVVHRTDETAYVAGAGGLAGRRLMTTDLPAVENGTDVRVAAPSTQDGAPGPDGRGADAGEADGSGSGAGGGAAAR